MWCFQVCGRPSPRALEAFPAPGWRLELNGWSTTRFGLRLGVGNALATHNYCILGLVCCVGHDGVGRGLRLYGLGLGACVWYFIDRLLTQQNKVPHTVHIQSTFKQILCTWHDISLAQTEPDTKVNRLSLAKSCVCGTNTQRLDSIVWPHGIMQGGCNSLAVKQIYELSISFHFIKHFHMDKYFTKQTMYTRKLLSGGITQEAAAYKQSALNTHKKYQNKQYWKRETKYTRQIKWNKNGHELI